jgi:sec-independent protein translocase protein TatA
MEMLIVGVVAVILFGSRLPSVARSLGKSLTEFKKGMREFENEMHSAVYTEPPSRVTHNEQIEHQPASAETTAVATAAEPQTSETHRQ